MAFALRRPLLALTLLGGLAPTLPQAGTNTGTLSVSATVAQIAYVAIPPITLSANLSSGGNSSASFNLTLSSGLQASLRFNQGQNAATGSSDTAPARRMAWNGNFLEYDLYQDAGYTIPWGNTAGSGKSVTGDGSTLSVPLYVKIRPNQGVPAGTYTDTITLSVDY